MAYSKIINFKTIIMDTFVQICGMTEAVCALVLMAVIGIASVFVSKKDVKNLDNPQSDQTQNQ